MQYVYLIFVFLFAWLATGSLQEKRRLEKKYGFSVEQIKKELARKGAEGYGSEAAYLYERTRAHFQYEVVGFVAACVLAALDLLGLS